MKITASLLRLSAQSLVVAGILAFPLAGTATASQTEPSVPTITIADEEIQPHAVETGGGHAFVLHNATSALASVAFDTPNGEGIACSPRGRSPRLSRTFVLAEGESIVCYAKPGHYGFTAYRPIRLATGGFHVSRSAGTIRVS